MLAYSAPACVAEHGIPTHPSELSRYSCISYRLTPYDHYRWAFSCDGDLLDIELPGPLTTATPSLYLGTAEAGLRLAYCPEDEVAQQVAECKLITVLEPWCPMFPGFSLFYPIRHHLGRRSCILIHMLKEHYQLDGLMSFGHKFTK